MLHRLITTLLSLTLGPSNPPASTKAPPPASTVELRTESGGQKPKLSADAKALGEKLATILPLSRKRLLELGASTVLAKKTVESETYVLSASRPVQGRAFLSFLGGNAFASPDGHGRAVFLASTASAQSSYFELAFPTRSERGYLVDCTLAGATSYFVAGAGAPLRTVPAPSDGHLTFGVRRQDRDGSTRLLVAGNRAFALSHCEIVPVE